MKLSLLSLAFLLLHAPPVAAQQAEAASPPKGVRQVLTSWCWAKIPVLELKEATFEQAYDALLKEWANQKILYGFPLILSDFVNQNGRLGEPRATMSLKDVPFSEAVALICQAYGKEIAPKAGTFRIESTSEPGDWSTRIHPAPSSLLKILELSERPESWQLIAAYRRRGIDFPEWAYLHAEGSKVVVMAREEQHQQVRWFHKLLEDGYTIEPIKATPSP